jgi:hypothetical protein
MKNLIEMAKEIEAKGVESAPGLDELAKLQRALREGGRATVTVTSGKTGQHVTVTLITRVRDGEGWVSRARKDGRVGILDADVLEARDTALEYPQNYIGRLYMDTGEWKPSMQAERSRVWTAERVIAAARSGRALAHDLKVASECSCCGRELTDPVSIDRGIGPECLGHVTGSKAAKREKVAA